MHYELYSVGAMLVGALVLLIIFAIQIAVAYFLIKWAVKHGTYEAMKKIEDEKATTKIPTGPAHPPHQT